MKRYFPFKYGIRDFWWHHFAPRLWLARKLAKRYIFIEWLNQDCFCWDSLKHCYHDPYKNGRMTRYYPIKRSWEKTKKYRNANRNP